VVVWVGVENCGDTHEGHSHNTYNLHYLLDCWVKHEHVWGGMGDGIPLFSLISQNGSSERIF
jgi:hypothetical protein